MEHADSNLKLNISTSTSSLQKPSPLQTITRKAIGKKGKHKMVNAIEANFALRPQRLRRTHLIEYQNRAFHKPRPYPFPSNLASPSDLYVSKRFLKGKWVPTKMDFLVEDQDPDADPNFQPIPGVPPGLELLSLTNHFYVQQVPRRDLPQTISTQLGATVANRYQVMCGDTKNRIYYGIAKYPVCTGLLVGYRPFRLFIMNHNLEIMMNFDKHISCLIFWFCGGYGTKITVTGPKGELYGTLVQRFHLFRPNFDILDSRDEKVFYIEGPPIIPFPLHYLPYFSKFKLYERMQNNSVSQLEPAGVYLEAAYGLGGHNMKNSLRVGFPRNIPFQLKGVILASLFQLYFTYYELGDQYETESWFRQKLRPLLRMNPFAAARVIRPYGYVRGKCNPYFPILIAFVIVVFLGYFWAGWRRWSWKFVPVA